MRVAAGMRVAMAAVAMAAGMGAQAAGPCWRTAEVQATRVRQMQTMLMVATLRCRAAKVDIVADYDAFVTRQTSAIAAANLRIKQHFADAGGSQADYDRFATSLANGFGDDDTTEASCAEAAALAREAGGAADAGALDALAAARLFPAALAGGACDAPPAPTMAAAAPPPAGAGAKAPPVVLLAAAAPPAPQPVTLPADVVAALTVMTRFRAAQSAPAAPVPAGATQIAAVAR